jgi:hypothetical protein
MSFGYQVSLRIQELISRRDEIRHQLDLREILSREEMLRLLVEAMEDIGFVRDEAGERLSRDEGEGIVTTLELDTLQISTTLSRERAIDVEAAAVVNVEPGVGEEEARQRLKAQVLGDEVRQVEREIADTLLAGEPARVEALNRVLEQVYSKALKTRAAQLGDVLEVSEGTNADGQYELVIKIEI